MIGNQPRALREIRFAERSERGFFLPVRFLGVLDCDFLLLDRFSPLNQGKNRQHDSEQESETHRAERDALSAGSGFATRR